MTAILRHAGAVSGAITQRPQCDVAPDMFWEGRTCSVLMTGPDALEPPTTAYYQQTVLPRFASVPTSFATCDIPALLELCCGKTGR